jgi:hypothetical protein
VPSEGTIQPQPRLRPSSLRRSPGWVRRPRWWRWPGSC